LNKKIENNDPIMNFKKKDKGGGGSLQGLETGFNYERN